MLPTAQTIIDIGLLVILRNSIITEGGQNEIIPQQTPLKMYTIPEAGFIPQVKFARK